MDECVVIISDETVLLSSNLETVRRFAKDMELMSEGNAALFEHGVNEEYVIKEAEP